MKRYMVVIFIFFLVFSQGSQVEAFYQSELEGTYNKQALIQALEMIDSLSKYQVNYQVLDKKTHALIMVSQILVDQEQNRYDIRIKYLPPAQEEVSDQDPAKSFYLHMLAFNQFEEVYLSSSSIVSPLGQIDYRFKNKDLMKGETFVPLTNTRYVKDIQAKELSRSLKFLPKTSILSIHHQAFSRQKQGIIGTLSRLAIPMNIFNFDQALSFSLRNHINLKTEEATGPEADLELGLDWNWKNRPFNWSYEFRGDYKDLQLTPMQVFNRYQFDAGQITNKLIHYRFFINPKARIYQAILEGLVEDFSLNIFDHQTAKYYTTNYQLLVQVQPYQGDILGPEDLEILSVQELEGQLLKVLEK